MYRYQKYFWVPDTPTGSVDCVQIIFFSFPIETTHHFLGFQFCKSGSISGWMSGFLLFQIFLFCDNICDTSKYPYIDFSDILGVYKKAILYQLLVVSIETKKKVM